MELSDFHGVKKDGRGGPREGAGRPSFVPTDDERKLVARLVGVGIQVEQVGSLVREGISESTLRKHFPTEILQGQILANSQVAESLFQQAIGGNVTAAIFWCKTRLGWREPPRQVEVQGNIAERFLSDIAAMEASVTALGGDEP